MYKFIRINEDEFQIVGAKTFTFTRTIDLARRLQSTDIKKTEKLIEYLAARGETIGNTKLRIERKEGNKTYIDESNLEAIKNAYEQEIIMEIINDIVRSQIGIDVEKLVTELKLTKEEAEQFGKDFFTALANGVEENTPRNEN